MSDIFISYAKEDRDRAEALAAALTQQKWSVWWDPAIPAGMPWDEVIEKALAEARCVIVLWSDNSVGSRFVRTEAGEAAEREILVPALIDDVEIPFAFRRLQAANLIDWDGAAASEPLRRLIEDLSRLLGRPPVEAEQGAPHEEGAKRGVEEEEGQQAEAAVSEDEDSPQEAVAPPTPPTAPEKEQGAERPGSTTTSTTWPVRKWSALSAMQRSALVIILIVLVSAWPVGRWLITGPTELIAVPDVRGQAQEDAHRLLEDAGLAVGDVTREESSGAEGTVIRQGVVPDTHVPPNTAVDLSIAEAITIAVPDTEGQTEADARQRLEDAGLVVGTVTRQESSQEEGTVIGQSIEPDARVPLSTVVDLSIAGPIAEPVTGPTELIAVPDTEGQSEAEARQRLEDAGLVVGTVTRVKSDRVEGTVIRQGIQPDTLVPPNTVVDLSIAERITIPVPDTVGQSEADARQLLEDAGLVVGTVIREGSVAPEGTVLRQGVEPGALAQPETAVDLVIAELEPGHSFRDPDCPECPEMVVIPAGSFTMGSPPREREDEGEDDEGPQVPVTIERPFALGKYEVTRAEFEVYAGETGNDWSGCQIFIPPRFEEGPSRSWREPGYGQGPNEPVVCVSWEDAQAYVDWLSDKTGQEYRLPSEAEWEYAARARTTMARPWGDDPDDACTYANVADLTAEGTYSRWDDDDVHQCRDRYVNTAPVGRLSENGFGLFDTLGNVLEWVQDCWNDSYNSAPRDGSAWLSGQCHLRGVRGGSWAAVPDIVRSADRGQNDLTVRYNNVGFRVARTLR